MGRLLGTESAQRAPMSRRKGKRPHGPPPKWEHEPPRRTRSTERRIRTNVPRLQDDALARDPESTPIVGTAAERALLVLDLTQALCDLLTEDNPTLILRHEGGGALLAVMLSPAETEWVDADAEEGTRAWDGALGALSDHFGSHGSDPDTLSMIIRPEAESNALERWPRRQR